MTPQEKANDLVQKFLINIANTVESSYCHSFVEYIDEAAKKCALIAVDEIACFLSSMEEDADLMFAKEFEYLKQVKLEIQNYQP